MLVLVIGSGIAFQRFSTVPLTHHPLIDAHEEYMNECIEEEAEISNDEYAKDQFSISENFLDESDDLGSAVFVYLLISW